jgi:6-phosphogluconolactonase
MSVTFEVVEDPARSCAALMVGAANADGDIVLAGGSTPKAAYGHFVEAVTSVGLDLARTTLWIGDERCVEPDDDRSNYKMIKESLLDPLGASGDGSGGPSLHRMRGELGPEQGAADYERVLQEAGRVDDLRFDLMLLGIGPDGHTLSLFPHQETLSERKRLVVGVAQAGHEPYVARVSMTLAAVALARTTVMLASGESKAEAIAEAFGGGAEPNPSIPSSMLPGIAKELIVLIDGAAASRLDDLHTTS